MVDCEQKRENNFELIKKSGKSATGTKVEPVIKRGRKFAPNGQDEYEIGRILWGGGFCK